MKYFVDEPDSSNLNLPLVGITEHTVFYDSLKQAEAECERRFIASGQNVVYCVWDENYREV